MSVLWILIAAFGIYIFLKFRSQKKAFAAFAIADESEPWLCQHGLDPSSGSFSVYSDPILVLSDGATAIVGHALTPDGKAVGYAVEVVSGKGVIRGEIIDPASVIGHHRHAAEAGRKNSLPILDVLRQMAKVVRADRAKQAS